MEFCRETLLETHLGVHCVLCFPPCRFSSLPTEIWLCTYLTYILGSQRWRSSIQSAKTRPGADCGSDHELLIANFRPKLKKVGKTVRPFRHDLNHIPDDYTAEVTNWFKEFDLIECLKNYGQKFMTLYRRQGSRPSPRKRNAKRQNGGLRRP